jgi:hypothetical protein
MGSWVPVRFPSWAADCFSILGRRVPRGPVSYFFFSSSFLFLFSYFFHRFCILHPNKVKPLSKFL